MTREPMRCPNDGARLVEIERSEILVDACPECRGVWLDRGEHFFAEVEGRKQRSSGAPREHEPSEDGPRRGRRKRSFLEDLLDFD